MMMTAAMIVTIMMMTRPPTLMTLALTNLSPGISHLGNP